MKMSAYEIATDRDFMDLIHWSLRAKALAPSPFASLLPQEPESVPSRAEAYAYALDRERKCRQRLLLKMLRAKWRDRPQLSPPRSPVFA